MGVTGRCCDCIFFGQCDGSGSCDHYYPVDDLHWDYSEEELAEYRDEFYDEWQEYLTIYEDWYNDDYFFI